jgi:hypothetical protein
MTTLTQRSLRFSAATALALGGLAVVAQPAPAHPASEVLTYAQLRDVSMVPDSADAWAIGEHFVANKPAPLILHRHRNRWREVTAKEPANTSLGSIAVAAKNSIWAAGSRFDTATNEQFPVIEHSTGKRFKPVTLKGAPTASLESIAASSPSNVWAGGVLNSTKLPYTTHWNGHRWKTVAVPGGTPGEEILSISTSGPKNAWAVADLAQDIETPFLIHWNGKRWRNSVFAPVPALVLAAVSTTSSTSAFAVGEVIGKAPYVMDWNGHKWSSVRVKGEAANTDPTMASVAAVGTGAFAVGYDETETAGYTQVAMRITAKVARAMPAAGGVNVLENQLFSVAANSKGAVAVGYATKSQTKDLELIDTLRENAFVRQSAPT